jgi:hypothetical protein
MVDGMQQFAWIQSLPSSKLYAPLPSMTKKVMSKVLDPIIRSTCTQPLWYTKKWYRKGTDLWPEFGKEASFGRKISSKDSIKILAVGSVPSFGRRAVCA